MKGELPAINQYATFRLHELLLGIELVHVQEVLRYKEMTEIPLAPSAVQGRINLRGQTVTAIDTRRGLKLPPRLESVLPMNIIVRYGDDLVSLLVDDIGEVVDVPHASLRLHTRKYAGGPARADQVCSITSITRSCSFSTRNVSWPTPATELIS